MQPIIRFVQIEEERWLRIEALLDRLDRPVAPADDKLLTVKDMASISGYSLNFIRQKSKEMGRIPGSIILVRTSMFEAWLLKRETPPMPPVRKPAK